MVRHKIYNIITRGGAVWKLVGLITRRSQVQILSPLLDAQIAQLVEQRTENPRVTGSIPVLGIKGKFLVITAFVVVTRIFYFVGLLLTFNVILLSQKERRK